VTSTIVSYDITDDLPISEIKLPENQLRSHHNLDELVVSISQRGLLHPIIVRTVNRGPLYEIVAGCGRYLACKKIGKRKIACQITDLSDKEAFEVSIIENVQRMTLEAMDEATAFKTYVSYKGWGGVSQLAAKLGKSVSNVTKRIMFLFCQSSHYTNCNFIFFQFSIN
jgi:ParB family chromosome partitioning protein